MNKNHQDRDIRLWSTGRIAVFTYVAMIYLLFRNPHGGWGDSIAYLVDAVNGFDWAVNATGHFLYTNAMYVTVRLLPWIEPADLLVLFSLVFAVLVLIRLYQTAAAITGSKTGAMIAAAVFGLSFTFWRQAEVIEVYTFHLFLVASMLFHLCSDLTAGMRKRVYPVAVWFGLALLTHIQTMLLLPLFLWYLFRDGKFDRRIAGALAVAAGALLFLVVTAALSDRLTVASVFFDSVFRDEVLAFDVEGMGMRLVKSIGYLLYNFHIWTAMMLWGLIEAVRNHRAAGKALILIIAPVWLFAFRYPVSDNYVFFLSAYYALAIAGGYGFRILLNRLPPCMAVAVVAAACIGPPAIYAGTLAVARNMPSFQHIGRESAHKGGLAYYCWPGMRDAADPFALARRQYLTGNPPPGIDPVEWNAMYPYAIAYLRHRGVIDGAPAG